MDGMRIAILRILNEEDHEEGEHRRDRIDEELPRRRELKEGTYYCPEDNEHRSEHECPARAHQHARRVCNLAEYFLHEASVHPTPRTYPHFCTC